MPRGRRFGWWRGALGAVTILAYGHAAHAQGDAATREAQARFGEGLHLHDAGHEEEARLKFAQAYAVLKRPNILFNLARSEQLTEHFLEALAHYKAYARDTDPKITPKDRDTAKLRIAELTKKVGHVSLTAPAGAQVTVDGVAVAGEAPFAEPLDVGVGKHVIAARVGEATKSVEVTAGEGETVAATIEIEAAPGATLPGAKPGEPTTPTNPPVEPAHPRRWTTTDTVYAVAAPFVLAAPPVIVGAIAAVLASNKSKQIDTDHLTIQHAGGNPFSFCAGGATAAPCADEASASSSRTTDVGIARAMAITGGVVFVGTAVVEVWRYVSMSHASDGAWIAPVVTRTGGTMTIGGRF